MKLSSLRAIAPYLRNIPELATYSQELDAELAKEDAKVSASRTLYDTAREVVMAHLNATPITVAELFTTCEDELPEGFTKSKLQYALLNYWKDEVVKIQNAKGANQYRRA